MRNPIIAELSTNQLIRIAEDCQLESIPDDSIVRIVADQIWPNQIIAITHFISIGAMVGYELAARVSRLIYE